MKKYPMYSLRKLLLSIALILISCAVSWASDTTFKFVEWKNAGGRFEKIDRAEGVEVGRAYALSKSDGLGDPRYLKNLNGVFFEIWPNPSSVGVPETQTLWYDKKNDMICIAVAEVGGTASAGKRRATLDGKELQENETLRQRLFCHSSGTLLMGNVSGQIGTVRFYPLWKVSDLRDYPSGWFEAETYLDGNGRTVKAYQEIRFDKTENIRLIEWRYAELPLP